SDRIMKAGNALQMFNILDASGGQVVDDVDFLPPAQQLFCEVGTDKASTSGDERTGRSPSVLLVPSQSPFLLSSIHLKPPPTPALPNPTSSTKVALRSTIACHSTLANQASSWGPLFKRAKAS